MSVRVFLPPVRPYRVSATLENGWSDMYGSMHLAAKHAGLALAPDTRMRGIWPHGCVEPWILGTPSYICGETPGAENKPVLVGRQEELRVLRANAYAHVTAAGLPIVYTRSSDHPRIPGSLLIMPTHSLAGLTVTDRSPYEAYAREIAAVLPHFDHAAVCLHHSCIDNGIWVPEFEALGLTVIRGADNFDLNALHRMRALFEQFETMTTNGWGSHVAYALAYGARVFVGGTEPEIPREEYLKDSLWSRNPELLDDSLRGGLAAKRRAFLEPFVVSPGKARADRALGRSLIGEENRLSPDSMRVALAEMLEPATWSSTLQLSRWCADRDARRAEAAHLAAAGKAPEAIRLLLSLVKAAIQIGYEPFLIDTLAVVADDLTPLEPGQAAFFVDQVRRLARTPETLPEALAARYRYPRASDFQPLEVPALRR